MTRIGQRLRGDFRTLVLPGLRTLPRLRVAEMAALWWLPSGVRPILREINLGNVLATAAAVDDARPLASELLEGNLTGKIIGVFYEVYNELGPGFPEFIPRRAMTIALGQAGLTAIEEAQIPIWFRGHRIVKFQADILVDQRVIVEVKACAEINEFHNIQLTNYLRASDIEVGLLLNFGKRAEFRRRVLANRLKHRHAVGAAPSDTSELNC
jgi:GxxExxY protein